MTKLEKAKEIIENKCECARFGLFDTRNLVGDPMHTIYEDEELTIDICYAYGYFEVFGLSEEEFNELYCFYESLVM